MKTSIHWNGVNAKHTISSRIVGACCKLNAVLWILWNILQDIFLFVFLSSLITNLPIYLSDCKKYFYQDCIFYGFVECFHVQFGVVSVISVK